MASDKKDKVASCEMNELGRILWANRKFCKMFGFAADEPMWHYLCDLFRHPSDWVAFHELPFEKMPQEAVIVRMKNRRGRSFKCNVLRTPSTNENGEKVCTLEIERLTESSKEESED